MNNKVVSYFFFVSFFFSRTAVTGAPSLLGVGSDGRSIGSVDLDANKLEGTMKSLCIGIYQL